MRTFLIGRAHSRIRYTMRAQAIGRANLRIYARYTVRARVTGRKNLCIYAHVTQCACAPLIGREIQAFTHVTQCACARDWHAFTGDFCCDFSGDFKRDFAARKLLAIPRRFESLQVYTGLKSQQNSQQNSPV